MAQSLLDSTKLRMVYQAGMDDKGEPILRAKTFSNVRKEATVDQLFQAAQAITVLGNDTLNKLERNDNIEILA